MFCNTIIFRFLVSISLLSILFLSCELMETTLHPEQKHEQFVSISEAPLDPEITASDIGNAHGEIIILFMNNIFNGVIKNDLELKRQFMINNGTDTETFKRIYIQSVNQYFALKDKNIRMTDDDFQYFVENSVRPLKAMGIDLIDKKKCTSDSAIKFLRMMYVDGKISDKCFQSCAIQVNRIEKYYFVLNAVNAHALLGEQHDSIGPEEFNSRIFNEISINSVLTWSMLKEDCLWIEDPELQEWWDWFLNSEKGKVIGGLLADAVGGLIVTAISGGNPYWGIAGGVGSSIAFCAWACDGPWPWE